MCLYCLNVSISSKFCVFFSWRAVHESQCSSVCGDGEITRTYKCLMTVNGQHSYVRNHHCEKQEDKPNERIYCQGVCRLPTSWQYGPWTEVRERLYCDVCSLQCG